MSFLLGCLTYIEGFCFAAVIDNKSLICQKQTKINNSLPEVWSIQSNDSSRDSSRYFGYFTLHTSSMSFIANN